MKKLISDTPTYSCLEHIASIASISSDLSIIFKAIRAESLTYHKWKDTSELKPKDHPKNKKEKYTFVRGFDTKQFLEVLPNKEIKTDSNNNTSPFFEINVGNTKVLIGIEICGDHGSDGVLMFSTNTSRKNQIYIFSLEIL